MASHGGRRRDRGSVRRQPEVTCYMWPKESSYSHSCFLWSVSFLCWCKTAGVKLRCHAQNGLYILNSSSHKRFENKYVVAKVVEIHPTVYKKKKRKISFCLCLFTTLFIRDGMGRRPPQCSIFHWLVASLFFLIQQLSSSRPSSTVVLDKPKKKTKKQYI